MDIAFYIPDGERFVSTEWTRGPWDPRFQHAGPASALLGRAIERLNGGEEFVVARFTVELLRGIPIRTLAVDARLARAGKRVQMAEATLRDEDGDRCRARLDVPPLGHVR